MKIYFINLDRHPERRIHMEKHLAGLDAERIAAIDARDWPETDTGLRRFERACLQSHRAAWLRFLASADRFACFLEDDVHLSNDFASFVQVDAWIPPDADAAKLDTYFNEVMLDSAATPIHDRRLALLHSRHESCAGYILSRKGAEFFLKATENPLLPVDYIVFPEDPLRQGLKLYQLAPAVVIQDSLYLSHYGQGENFQTSVQAPRARRTLAHKAQREVLRLYKQVFKARNYLYRRLILGLKPEIVEFR
jgi:GR25 family glycosyltransferase involved in LPS biosynthesis